MSKKKQLTGAKRVVAIAVGTLDTGLRAWALADLARRPAWEIRGNKKLWAGALTIVSSAGVLPAVYLRWGRHAS